MKFRFMGSWAAATLGAGALILSGPLSAETLLRIGMTASDIPLTAGQPDNGFEGYRFTGYTIYDALVNWDLSSAEKASDIRPGLATAWTVKSDDRSEEHTSELQSLMRISYAVFCLKKKIQLKNTNK